jgi:cysteine protease ATG4
MGYQNDDLLYLDPHFIQQSIRVKDHYTWDELQSYHCAEIRVLPLRVTDPSLVIGFLCRSISDFKDFCMSCKDITHGSTPLFTIEDHTPDYQQQEVDILGFD